MRNAARLIRKRYYRLGPIYQLIRSLAAWVMLRVLPVKETCIMHSLQNVFTDCPSRYLLIFSSPWCSNCLPDSFDSRPSPPQSPYFLQGWPRDKPFTFDIAAASALCEGPDYDAASLVVGFTAAQHWALKLQVG